MSLNCHFPFLYCSRIRNALSLKTVKRYPAVSGASFPQQEADGYGGSGMPGSGMPERVRQKRYARKRYAGKQCARTGTAETVCQRTVCQDRYGENGISENVMPGSSVPERVCREAGEQPPESGR